MEEGPGRGEEYEAVRAYCCERPLERPGTTVKTAVWYALLFCAGTALVCFGAVRFVLWLGTGLHVEWIAAHPAAASALCCAACAAACFALALKRMVIGLVRLYQHYAPEGLRRKCILKPTCSEYAILAVKKYGAPRGMLKSACRLLVTCRGWNYRVDEP